MRHAKAWMPSASLPETLENLDRALRAARERSPNREPVLVSQAELTLLLDIAAASLPGQPGSPLQADGT